jgi:hypothetical protein
MRHLHDPAANWSLFNSRPESHLENQSVRFAVLNRARHLNDKRQEDCDAAQILWKRKGTLVQSAAREWRTRACQPCEAEAVPFEPRGARATNQQWLERTAGEAWSVDVTVMCSALHAAVVSWQDGA